MPRFGSLLGLGIGMTLALFQMWGIVFVLRAMLKNCVRYESACGPRCFRCCMLMLSGPVELLFLQLLMAALTSLLVRCMFCVVSLRMFLLTILFCLSV